MTAPKKKIKEFFIITKDKDGHIKHYKSETASMHLDLVLQYDIDLDKETVIEKGFILNSHKIVANWDIRKTKKKRKDGNK